MKINPASVLDDALYVRRTHGKGLLRQAAEIARIKRRNPTLSATDYFAYRLYDPAYLGSSPPENFLGGRCQAALAHALNLRALVMPAWDKFSFALVARTFGLPMPRLRAIYMPGPAATSGVADVALNGRDALAGWLRTQDQWPIAATPSYGPPGHGCHRLTGYRPSDDSLTTQGGEAMPVDDFVDNVVGHSTSPSYVREMGYLFQEAMRAHRSIAELLGSETISAVRLVLIQDERGAEVIGALWKLASGAFASRKHDVDGTPAEPLTGRIDLETGRLHQVLTGCWPRATIVAGSPDTHRPFEGFVVPHWQEVVALCIRAARVFPLLRLQHWDVGVTDDGPLLLELHDEGSVVDPQLWGRGLLTERMRALLRDGAYGNAFAWLGPPSP